MTKPKRPWMTVRHCRMRLRAIEEVLSDLIAQVSELSKEWENHWKDEEDDNQ